MDIVVNIPSGQLPIALVDIVCSLLCFYQIKLLIILSARPRSLAGVCLNAKNAKKVGAVLQALEGTLVALLSNIFSSMELFEHLRLFVSLVSSSAPKMEITLLESLDCHRGSALLRPYEFF